MIFRSLDGAEIRTLKTTWLQLLHADEHEVFVAEYQQVFDLIEETRAFGELDRRYNTPIYFGVFGEDDGRCWALVELVQSKNGRSVWIKMMDVHLSPDLEIDDTGATTAQRLAVFKSALNGIFLLTKAVAAADTVKVYGRTNDIFSLLRGMRDELTLTSLGTLPGIQVSIEGRWLVFRTPT